MNRSFDGSTTSLNTLLNSCDRWEKSDREVLLLKVPKRRPSISMPCFGGDELALTMSSDDEKALETAYDKRSCPDEASLCSAFDPESSGTWLYVPQFPVPENKHLRQRIRFADAVEQREYAVTIGDNPSCHGPCALTLDWSHTETQVVDYNDVNNINESIDDGDCSLWLPSNKLAKYLSTDERRERVLEFMPALGRDELQQLELRVAAPTSGLLDKRIKPTRRQAVWQKGDKGHIRRPSYDD
ncbi:hypothetical protein MPSEU_001042400 [Mayamaea pseudoterrestris]|nr:hypothetical protein MPSEU_001042400 [Mayamaea pseudoterrestris]